MKRRAWLHRFAWCAAVSLFFAASVLCGEKALEARGPASRPELQSTPEKTSSPPSALPPGAASTERGTGKFTLSHERYEQAVAYSRAEYTLYFVSAGLSVAVLLLLLRLGVPAKLRDFAEGRSGRWVVQGLIFIPAFLLLLDALDLPVRIFGHSLSLKYGQSVQGWGSWFWDWTKAELLAALLGLVLVLILFAVIRKSPRRWWLWFWAAALPILLFAVFIEPWLVDPLFFKFEPLAVKHPEMVSSMERVIQRAKLNIPPDRMFLMQAGEKTNAINAYVTGFAASNRVVVWDTTIQKMTADETLFIFGHEAGHYVLGHIRDGFLFFAAMLLGSLFLAFRLLHWALDRWGGSWKVYAAGDWASLAVLMLILELLVFFSSPMTNGFSRRQEHNADVYGLEVIHGIVPNSAEAAAHAFQVLGDADLEDPNPSDIVTIWLYSHPPLADRLVFAHTYDPWGQGKAPKYVKQ